MAAEQAWSIWQRPSGLGYFAALTGGTEAKNQGGCPASLRRLTSGGGYFERPQIEMQTAHAWRSVADMRRTTVALFACFATLLPGACHTETSPVCPGSDVTEPLLCDRPVNVSTPLNYNENQAYPLLVELHGYASTVDGVDRLFGLRQTAAERGFLFVAPDGTRDETNLQFWNATDGCCNLFNSGTDDSSYLAAVLRDTKQRYRVDPNRIYVVGHSNGGFMAYRLACDHAEELAAVVSVAGATWLDEAKCHPQSPVSVLQVHGDQDGIIHYDGGRFASQLALYPSARETVAQWAKHNRCSSGLNPRSGTFDFDSNTDGDESKIEQYSACSQSAVELWTLRGGEHFPAFTAAWREQLFGFLLAHPKSNSPTQ